MRDWGIGQQLANPSVKKERRPKNEAVIENPRAALKVVSRLAVR